MGKLTLQYAPLSIVDKLSKLAISDDIAFGGFIRFVVYSAIFGIHNVLLIEAEVLDVDPPYMAYTSDLWKDHSFSACDCGFVLDGYVFLDTTLCYFNLNRDVK